MDMFGGGANNSALRLKYKSILGEQVNRTAEEEDAFKLAEREAEEERLSLTQRSRGGRGGGRTGLMFGGNQQGVV